jgi:serine/threonine protein kinase
MSPSPTASPPPLAEHDALPAGTRFGELEIIRVLGAGGFGIVYLARDHALERHVALKEYMPASLAMRGAGPLITVRSGSHAQTYAIGLRSFINEARLLARFDHPSLVKVYRFWEDNATAYMVMPYLQGRTLRDVRRAMSVSPSELFIRSLLDALLSALDLLHREGVFHRDIAPDNILLPPDGPPVLLDFGAARRVISDRTQSLTAILKPNYAPIEQYAEMTQMRQGPWTDLYALGAVAHFLLFGAPPPPATARAVHDELGSLAQRLVPGISPRLLATVAWMLAVRPQQRPQNVDELRAVLDGRNPVPVLEAPRALPASDLTLPLPGRTEFPPTLKVDSIRSAETSDPHADDTVIRPAVVRSFQPAAAPVVMPAPNERAGMARGRWLMVTGLIATVAAAGYWQMRTPAIGVDAPAPAASAAAVPAADAAASVVLPAEPAASAVAPSTDNAAMAAAVAPAAAVAAEPAAAASRPPATARPATSAARRVVATRAAQAAEQERAAVATSAAPVADSSPAVAADAETPTTARQACGKRVFLALWTCMDRECERPGFREHPDCVKVLETKRRRGQ